VKVLDELAGPLLVCFVVAFIASAAAFHVRGVAAWKLCLPLLLAVGIGNVVLALCLDDTEVSAAFLAATGVVALIGASTLALTGAIRVATR